MPLQVAFMGGWLFSASSACCKPTLQSASCCPHSADVKFAMPGLGLCEAVSLVKSAISSTHYVYRSRWSSPANDTLLCLINDVALLTSNMQSLKGHNCEPRRDRHSMALGRNFHNFGPSVVLSHLQPVVSINDNWILPKGFNSIHNDERNPVHIVLGLFLHKI